MKQQRPDRRSRWRDRLRRWVQREATIVVDTGTSPVLLREPVQLQSRRLVGAVSQKCAQDLARVPHRGEMHKRELTVPSVPGQPFPPAAHRHQSVGTVQQRGAIAELLNHP